MLLRNQTTTIEKQTNIATTLMASDYNGFGNQPMNGVIEVMADVNVLGSLEAKFESTNRVYDVGGVVQH